jgi:hypothetical protein
MSTMVDLETRIQNSKVDTTTRSLIDLIFDDLLDKKEWENVSNATLSIGNFRHCHLSL